MKKIPISEIDAITNCVCFKHAQTRCKFAVKAMQSLEMPASFSLNLLYIMQSVNHFKLIDGQKMKTFNSCLCI